MAPPVAGYTAWWDATAISGVADAAKLSSWSDLSGHGWTLSQVIGANQPTFYKTTAGQLINGLPAVWFDGAATYMSNSSLTVAQPYTLLVVARSSDTGTSRAVYGNSTQNAMLQSNYPAGIWVIYNGTALVNSTTPADTSLHVFAHVANSSASAIWVDGTKTAGNPGTAALGGPFVFGARSDSPSLVWNGPICEMIIYPSPLSDADINSTTTYLTNKWLVPTPPTPTPTPPATGCVRSAWLTLGSSTVQLEDTTKGYFCTQLDLGYPAPREVMSSRPDQDGVDDRTQYMGARVVSANITALQGAGARVDDVADNFARYMVPSARPVLHWILDRPGAPERTLTVRGTGYSWPVAGPYQRDIQLQWMAADPIARDPTVNTATAWTGGAGGAGRAYPLTFPRVYPAGTTSPNSAVLSTPGDVALRPLLRVYGPITAANIQIAQSNPNTAWNVRFVGGYVIDAGHYVDVDCAQKSALRDGDPAQPVISKIDWTSTTWPAVAPLPATGLLSMSGGGTSALTQVQAIWQDGYLS